MRDFNWHQPQTIAEAAALLQDLPDARAIAGGQTLIPSMKLRLTEPADLVDLSGISGLSGVARDGHELVIGAMTTHAVVATSPLVRDLAPALAELAGLIGDPAVRHRGTIGGSIANADPSADYPAGVLGLGATIVTNRRRIAADAMFLGLFETALEPGEIITSVRAPAPKRAHYLKLPHPASGFAVVGVFVADFGGSVRVAVTGAGPCAFRVPAMEAALVHSFQASALEGIAIEAADLMSDVHYSATYRAHAAGVLARRAVQAIAG